MAEIEIFSVACPRCGAKYDVPLALLGKKAQCPGCSAKFAMEPPPGPEGRELRARLAALHAGEEPAVQMTNPEDGEVVNNLNSVKALMEQKAREQEALSTHTVKLARFKKNPFQKKLEENGNGTAVNRDALQAALQAQRNRAGSVTITSEKPADASQPAEGKKWWKFW